MSIFEMSEVVNTKRDAMEERQGNETVICVVGEISSFGINVYSILVKYFGSVNVKVEKRSSLSDAWDGPRGRRVVYVVAGSELMNAEVRALERLGAREGRNIVAIFKEPGEIVRAFELGVTEVVDGRVDEIALIRSICECVYKGANEGISLVNSGGARSTPAYWLPISGAKEVIFTPHTEILYFEACNKYTNVICERGQGLVRLSGEELLERISDSRFRRIHRGTVINIEYVRSVVKNEVGQMYVRLIGREVELLVSKQHQSIFKPH